MEEAEVKPRVRGRNRGLVAILVVLVLAIVGLSVGIFVVNLINKKAREAELENLSGSVLDLMFNEETAVDKEEITQRLEKIMENSNNQDEKVEAAFNLVVLSNNKEEKEELLKNLLGEDLDSKKRYRVLCELLHVYGDYSDEEGQKYALSRLLDLPDDMVLEYEDWSMIKPMFRDQYDDLMEKDYDN